MLNRLLALLCAATTLLAFAPPVQAVDIGGGITNLTPAVFSVSLSSSSLTPTAGTTTSTTATVVVTDGNGYNDISTVTVGILKPDGTTQHLAQASASFSSGSALSATYTKSLAMNFYDAATSGILTYKVKVIVTDAAGASATNLASLTTFTFAELAALSAPSSMSLGSSLNPGEASSIGSLTITNAGNVQIDTQVSGTALTLTSPSASIPVSAISYGTASDLTGASPLSGSSTTLSTFNLAGGSSSTKSLYFQVTVPDASTQYVPAGTYTGTLTVTALSG